MKILLRNEIHDKNRSHDVTIIEAKYRLKIKLTYEAYNAVERYTGEAFTGTSLNTLFDMSDLGVQSNSSAYVTPPYERQKRSNELYNLALKFIEALQYS
jgi:hypothetical protein